MTKFMEMLGKSRCLAVPLAVIGVIAAVTAAGVVETRAERAATCGLAISIQDPDLWASLARFDRHQSAAARKVCDFYRDRH
ncbi:MAG: hypothetical protein JO328_15720 [Hyphomicrobiales bacterium]|nr:hypothetical protein [Hyphomicrobiales bacterium]MBV8823827.1 hypothetical protein [Hyphomicrobiales bacterium]MBV9429992.1 hypothetical protein [Bradyrhizobiaceae bacterium]